MLDRKRDIFIKLEELSEIVDIMLEIKEKEEKLKGRFYEYDKLSLEENKIFENWNVALEDVVHKLDHVTL